MQPAAAGGAEGTRLGGGVVIEDGGVLPPSLDEANTGAILQSGRWKEHHHASPSGQMRRSAQNRAELARGPSPVARASGNFTRTGPAFPPSARRVAGSEAFALPMTGLRRWRGPSRPPGST